MSWRTVLLFPDTHVPDHNMKAVRSLLEHISHHPPAEIIHLGDLMDTKAPARWSRATADEWAGTLQSEVDASVRLLEQLRAVFDGPLSFHMGNHERRIQTYLRKYGPAMASLHALHLPNLLQFERLQVTQLPDYHKVAPGWVTTHGDHGSLNANAGSTALGLAKKIGYSVACGHTHRMGLIPFTSGIGHNRRTVWGLEAGNLMDLGKASYLPSFGAANWQTGFAYLHISNTRVTAELVSINVDGSFSYQGRVS